MKHLLLFTVFTLCIVIKVNSQEAWYPVKNYSTKDYGKDFHPTNLAITQDQRGIIYAANGFNLLEFDGANWRSYPINKEKWILSLAVDSDGLVYAGSQNEFGLFEPDLHGELKYRSLSDSLNLDSIYFTNVWAVHALAGGMVFHSEEKIFIYRNGEISVINPKTSFHTSFVINDRFFVRQRSVGIMELKGESLEKIGGSELFDTTGIFLMVPLRHDNNNILIGTRDKGFWLYESDSDSNPFHQFNLVDSELLKESVITGGIRTGDGDIAISTMLNGVVVIDTAGNTSRIINKSQGLLDNDVKQLLLDRSQNLWLALNNGISRVEIGSPLTFLSESSGIVGSINSILRYNDLLYAGTSSGLFIQNSDAEKGLPFKPAFDFAAPVRSLINAEESLLIGTDEGLFRVFNTSISKIGSEESYSLYYSDEMRLLFSGGPKGLTAYRLDRDFRLANSFRIDGEDIIAIAGEKVSHGKDAIFWLGTRYNGVVRLTVKSNFTFTCDKYDSTDGLPDGWVIPAIINSKSVFHTISGLYGFIGEDVVRETLPDSLKNNPEFAKGYFSGLSLANDTTRKSVSLLVEGKNKVWICSDNDVGYFTKDTNMNYVDTPFRGIETAKIYSIYPEENGICWIGTTDGLVRYDENRRKNYDLSYHTLIRRVSLTGNDSTLFSGTYFTVDQGNMSIVPDQPPKMKPTLPFRNNSVRIDFSAAFYETSLGVTYSVMLEGNDARWSQWTEEDFREFTNLREGNYTFNVKAKNIYGKEGIPARYSFTILSPWYRSVIAYVGYAILLLILFWLFARLYTYRLKRENIRLEGLVAERTAEVVHQKNEIENKNEALEEQKKEIEDSIRYAKRIQSAVIPSEKVYLEIIPRSFVLFRPLNIVSGDFYWISRVGNVVVFAVADCTGHGVPGAFMSMLGVAFLNEIVNKDRNTNPDIILNLLREKVIKALQQQGIEGEARDGMDIAIVCIDKEERRLEYAGAYNPLIMIRNGEIIETAADKMPIGIHERMAGFKRHEIRIQEGDLFYMSSDGYQDQFGGPEGKKFKTKRFKELLLEIHSYSMTTQKEILEKTFEEWKGDCPQVDDIVVAGLAID